LFKRHGHERKRPIRFFVSVCFLIGTQEGFAVLNASRQKPCKVFTKVKVHLNEKKASGNSNRRNGKTKKTVRGLNTGTFELESGRDRSGTFEPKVVPKRQLIITEQLEGHVLSMYAKGMSTRAISDFIREMYAMEISATEISRITESVMPAVNEWRSRPLEAVYPFVFPRLHAL